MAANITQIQPYTPGTNPAESWKDWKDGFQIYLMALKYHKEDPDVQIALFRQIGGKDIKELFETLEFPNLANVS